MAEATFVQHGGKRILRLDYSGLAEPQIIALMEEARSVIAAEPRRSVRLLSIAPAHITEPVVEALKAFAAHNARFVIASAIVSGSSFQKAAITLTIVSRGRLNVETFEDEGRAKDWLATVD